MENTMTNKRDIFAELTEGFDALKSEREGKLTLRNFKVESKPAPNPMHRLRYSFAWWCNFQATFTQSPRRALKRPEVALMPGLPSRQCGFRFWCCLAQGGHQSRRGHPGSPC